MKKLLSLLLLVSFLTLLIACNDENTTEAENNDDVLITFQDKTITVLDAENAILTADQDREDAARSLLFHELVLVEADIAGTSYDPYDLEVLINQTVQLYEYDDEAATFITEKSALYNLDPVVYIDTIWKDFLRNRLIVNNHLNVAIGFDGKTDEEVTLEVANFEEEMLQKYAAEIEYHF